MQRVLAALLMNGRSSIIQLAQNTSLSPRHLRNGLGVLIQQNLLFYSTDSDTSATSYEANIDACYNLVRSGKILEVVESQHGRAGRDLVQTLLLLGCARVADLTHAFGSRAPNSNPNSNGHANGTHQSGSGLIESEDHLHMVLTRLIQDEVVETVRPDSLRNPAEVYREIEAEVTKTAPGEKASRNKIEQHMHIVERYQAFRDQSRTLKRQLDKANGPVAKRMKLQNGNAHADDPFADDLLPLNPDVVVRINHGKCLVQLRNQRLAEFAADALGEATGQVYHALLELLTVQLARCRPDQLSGDQGGSQQITVSSIEVYEHLDEGVNVQSGIGKAPREKIDFQSAEKVRPSPLDCESDSDDPDVRPPVRGRASRTVTSGGHDEFDESSDDDGHRAKGSRSASGVNGDRQTKVKFEDEAASKDNRLDQMRQHLLLLAESKHRFVRHCGINGRGQWTVDFGQLMESLREAELDAYIQQSFGRHGLRLTRILREKGKLDEKMLPSAALMKKSDVQGKMLAMQMAGLVDVQEVPKDNSRLANRTLFFWFFDGERTQSQLLDDVYKAMLRCLQTLQVERHKERNILSFVERKDVKGKEEEVMTAEHYNKYNRHLEEQEKLLGQVMRLDDMVAVLRDY
ncbi:DNA-directed RNA polymerase III subunit rpc3 [Ophiocordyceps sinensis CO18]|uniref:DNA-directed RNA polymerase III subunit RPC3 n=1 Tax=Ophiocordyceps sinensis (strain Co18 / CGMCC 3.14243) TaxID=911162 RepID=T5AD31_OPHSC|nr:DNA-directed RNA polymerase III subunit rpc3 [Ophiocordyceps sinensis CO18]